MERASLIGGEEKGMETIEVTKYSAIASKRRYWIIIPLLIGILVGLTYVMIAPRIYRGETLILVVAQKVPEAFVRSIVAVPIQERLQTIKQQVTSRTNLEAIIAEYDLFGESKKPTGLMDSKVEMFRKRIGTNVTQGSAFTIFFEYEDPQRAMAVANKLASNFINENLKMREEGAFGTSQFLKDELNSVQRALEEREELTKQYRQKHMGELPENLNANLSTLGRLQNQQEQLNSSLMAAEQRKLLIQQQVANAKLMEGRMAELGLNEPSDGTVSKPGVGQHESNDIRVLKQQLLALEGRYTENHPDVVRLRETIARRESKVVGEERESTSDTRNLRPEQGLSMADMLRPEVEKTIVEMQSLKTEIQKVKSQVGVYERRVEDTPKREQELITLSRDYDNLRSQYNSLLQRKIEAEMALSMEKKQKGEQFRIIDPAKLPDRPVRPDVTRILMIAAAFGLCVGGGCAYLAETLDTSLKSPEEVEQALKVPVLVSLPLLYTEGEKKRQRRRSLAKAATVYGGFLVLAFCIVFASKGGSKTMNFIIQLF